MAKKRTKTDKLQRNVERLATRDAAHRESEINDKRSERAANITPESHPNLEEEIRRRAYAIYEERGREHGRDVEDWLRAEAEITGTNAKAAAA
jgi:Protein of unknown function (DUF2934)